MRSLVSFYLAFVLAVLVGCTGTKAVYQRAHTPPQYAKAVLLHHNAIGEQIANLRADPAVSEGGKEKLLTGYRTTVCNQVERDSNTSTATCAHGAAQRLQAAASAYESAANAQTEAELQAAVNELVGLIAELIPIVNGAK